MGRRHAPGWRAASQRPRLNACADSVVVRCRGCLPLFLLLSFVVLVKTALLLCARCPEVSCRVVAFSSDGCVCGRCNVKTFANFCLCGPSPHKGASAFESLSLRRKAS